MGSDTAMAARLYLFKQPLIDPLRDFEFACSTLVQGFVVTVDAKSPIKDMKDLTAHLREKKSKASYATATVAGTVLADFY